MVVAVVVVERVEVVVVGVVLRLVKTRAEASGVVESAVVPAGVVVVSCELTSGSCSFKAR